MKRRATIAIVGSFVAVGLVFLGWILYSTDFFSVFGGKIRSGASSYRGQQLGPQPVPQSGWEPAAAARWDADSAAALTPERVAELWASLAGIAAENNWQAWGYVVDADTGQVLLAADEASPHTPASTLKIFTALVALDDLESTAVLETGTTLIGTDLYLWGEGDLLLGAETGSDDVNGRAGLEDLARDTAEQLASAGVTSVSLVYQDALFAGQKRWPGWQEQEVQDFAGDVSPFAIDTGRTAPDAWAFVDDSAQAVADVFAAQLRTQGIDVAQVRPGVMPQDTELEVVPLAAVQSATVGEQIAEMLRDSDNTLAEQYCHLAAASSEADTTFQGSTSHLLSQLNQLGVDTQGMVLRDCSGLDEESRVTAPQLVSALQASALEETGARALVRSLPRAGINGTLGDRLGEGPAAGNAQAKTGSLEKTSTLAGVVTTGAGQTLVYAVGMDEVPDGEAYLTRAYIDSFVDSLVHGGSS